jgi:replicative DNA helicase
MTKSSYFPDVAEILVKEDFYLEKHSLIFDSIEKLINEEIEPDIITVCKKIEDSGQLDAIGGKIYIDKLFSDVTWTSEYNTLARRIKQFSQRREIIKASEKIIHKSLDSIEDFESYLDQSEKGILDATSFKSKSTLVHVKYLRNDFISYLENVKGSEGGITGLRTFFYDLDQITAGFHPGQLIILAARPGMGKTTFALNIANNVALRGKKPVAIFSLEMSKMELLLKMACSDGMLNTKLIQRGLFSQEDSLTLLASIKKIFSSPMYIDDSADIVPRTLRQKVKRLTNKTELGLIIVDYLQLMSDPEAKKLGRQNEVAQISRSLKLLAKSVNAPILALSQLSRNVENRSKEQRPQLSDLRDSGAIEQDADMVMFIYREEKVKERLNEEVPVDKKGKAEIIVAKHRTGPTGDFMLSFRDKMSRFDNIGQEGF